jgi:competence protein ComEC
MAANRVQLGAGSSQPVPFQTKYDNTLITWKNIRIVIAKGPVPPNLDVDILILSNNAFKTFPKAKMKILIIDSSNSFYLAERLLRQPAPLGVEVYSVAHRGAFQYSF